MANGKRRNRVAVGNQPNLLTQGSRSGNRWAEGRNRFAVRL